jgi:hypothetical protein
MERNKDIQHVANLYYNQLTIYSIDLLLICTVDFSERKIPHTDLYG